MNHSQESQMASTFICSRRLGIFLWPLGANVYLSSVYVQSTNTALYFCGHPHFQATKYVG